MSTSPASAVVADPEQRFQAFVIDRVIAWACFGAATAGAWWWFFREGTVWAGIGLILGTVLVVSLAFAIPAGLSGRTPGKALRSLRLVDIDGGGPIGVPRSLLRSVVVGAGSLPMFGLGVATLAWTTVEDRTRERRGWHDHVARSIVIDVRPRPVIEAEAEEKPRHVVNLTAMKLMPVRHAATPVVPAPPAGSTPSGQVERQAGGPPERPAGAPGRPVPQQATASPQQTPPRSTPPGPVAPTPAPPVAPFPGNATPHPGNATPHPGVAPGIPTGPRTQERPAPNTPPPEPGPSEPPMRQMIWRVTLDSGETLVVEGLGLVGRDPTARPGEPVRHVLPLTSGDMSISKTHAQLHLASDGALVVTDRGSTNGSILVRKGVSRELAAGRPATLVDGDRVVFGDRSMHVTRER